MNRTRGGAESPIVVLEKDTKIMKTRNARWTGVMAGALIALGSHAALAQPGGFHPCLSERELEVRAQTLTRLLAQPGLETYPFEVLDHAALAERIPGIGSAVVGGTYTRLDGHVNALKLLRALHAGFGKHGGTYLPNTRTDLDFEGDIYGERMDLEILARVRGEVRFESVAQLKAQIAKDVDSARNLVP